MTRKKADSMGLPVLATIRAAAMLTMAPNMIAVVPGPTIEKALKSADLTLDDIDLIEINEAFAAMPLVSSKVLAQTYYNGGCEKARGNQGENQRKRRVYRLRSSGGRQRRTHPHDVVLRVETARRRIGRLRHLRRPGPRSGCRH